MKPPPALARYPAEIQAFRSHRVPAPPFQSCVRYAQPAHTPPLAEDSSDSSLAPPAKFFLQSFDSLTTPTQRPDHDPQSTSKHRSAAALSCRCTSYTNT